MNTTLLKSIIEDLIIAAYVDYQLPRMNTYRITVEKDIIGISINLKEPHLGYSWPKFLDGLQEKLDLILTSQGYDVGDRVLNFDFAEIKYKLRS